MRIDGSSGGSGDCGGDPTVLRRFSGVGPGGDGGGWARAAPVLPWERREEHGSCEREERIVLCFE